MEINQQDSTVSCAAFPENRKSFAVLEGHLFDTHNFKVGESATHADRLIEYYNLYGDDLFTKLRGGYSLVIWDSAKRRLLAGRDHIGQIPFYYFQDGDQIIISSSMKALLKQPGVPADLNRVMIAEHLLNNYPDNQLTETFFAQVRRLPPAHFLQLHNQSLTTTRYWDPFPPDFQWASEEEINTFTELFEQAVERCLSAGADSILLSGGYDSTAIAAMANRISKGGRYPALHAISAKVEGTGADEGPIQAEVTSKLKLPQTIFSSGEVMAGKSVIQTSLDISGRCPFPSLNLMESFTSELMGIAKPNGLSKVMAGTGGDELFLIHSDWGYDLIAELKFRLFLQYCRMMANYTSSSSISYTLRRFLRHGIIPTLKPILRRGAQAAPFNPPPWLSRNDTKLIQKIEQREINATQAKNTKKGNRYLQSLRSSLRHPWPSDEHKYYYDRAAGYSVLYPYYDVDLMDLAYRISPEYQVRAGLIKAPINRFLHNNDPPINLPEVKTSYSPFIHGLLRSEGKEAWNSMRGAKELEKLDIIDRISLSVSMEKYFSCETNDWNLAWHTLSTEAWLRNYI